MSYLHFPPLSFPRLDGEKNGRFQIFPPHFPLFHPFSPLSFLSFPPWSSPSLHVDQDSKFFPLIFPFSPPSSPFVSSLFPPWPFPRLDGGKNSRFQIFPPYFPLLPPLFPLFFPLGYFHRLMGEKIADSKFSPLIFPYSTPFSNFVSFIFPPWPFPRLDGEKKWQIPNFSPLI